MLNCKINQNIRKECNTQVGGIYDTIYLYDIDDVESLSFTNDTRYDSGASVATINSTKPFFTFEVSDGEYHEQNDGDEYTHELTFNIHKTQDIEKILSDAKNSNLLVCFRLKTESSYRMIGWNLGAKLTYELQTGDDGNYYTVTLTDESEYPSFETDPSNFNLRGKTFDPLFVPNFGISTCETSGGSLTGYRIASYVTKQNSVGEPLDVDNKLCEYSGKKQVAYKLSGLSDGQYEIIGTYGINAVYNGQAVRMYDPTHCSSTGSGTITVSPTTIILSAHSTPQVNMSITTDDTWSIVSNTPFATLSKYNGKGNGNVVVSYNGLKSPTSGNIQVRNENTNEVVTVNTEMFGVWLSGSGTIPYSSPKFTFQIDSAGGSGQYEYEITNPDGVQFVTQRSGNTYTVTVTDKSKIPPTGTIFTITANHKDYPNEKDVITVKIVGDETRADWNVVSQRCELVDGNRTGYLITKYRDMNPKSATYGSEKEEKTISDDCAVGTEKWVAVSKRCEIDDFGQNTGNVIAIEMQTTEGLPTTGQTRERKYEDRIECPLNSTKPEWVTISEICRTDTYGQDGTKESLQKDQNILSPTFNTTRTVIETDNVLCPPNREPYWDVVSSVCLQSEGKNTGFQKITMEDVNPRSYTVGQRKDETVYNEVDCPLSTTPSWINISVVCDLDDDGDNTGYATIIQKDFNPNSPTYNTTREIREYNVQSCPLPTSDPRWETITFECLVDSEGYNTGMCQKTQRDTNKKSESYNETRTITEEDRLLCPSGAKPQWEVQDTSCETDAYGQTGNKVTTYIDVNPKSSTYMETKVEKTYDAVSCRPNTDPYWITESSECENEE